MIPKHLISIEDISQLEFFTIIKQAVKLKKQLKATGANRLVLKNRTLAMIFEKPSLRTRVSFEAGMTQLGGHAIYLAPSDISMGTREPVSDVSVVTSSMVDAIMARTFKHETIEELAKHSSVPVINGLSDMEHPCQILADFMTIYEIKKRLKGLIVAFIGDCNNNVTHSMALASALLGMEFRCGGPKSYWMDSAILKRANVLAKKTNVAIQQTSDPKHAVRGADIVVTDTWVSMGNEKEKIKRQRAFKRFQVNSELMKLAKKDAIFLHCLPAYRGYEVTSDVIDGSCSVVFQEAENRLHAQKALLCFLLRIK